LPLWYWTKLFSGPFICKNRPSHKTQSSSEREFKAKLFTESSKELAFIETMQLLAIQLMESSPNVIKLKLVGSISLSQDVILQQSLETTSQIFGSFQLMDDGLVVLPDDTDFSDLRLTGFAEATVKQLREKMSGKASKR
jgi:hypothetical protein